MPLSLAEKTEIIEEFAIHPGDTGSPEVQIAFYRIAQESFNNIIKHARAGQVSVNLDCTPSHASLAVQDNGRGFEVTNSFPGHMGLNIMRERAKTIGATLIITSQAGQGTRIALNWSDQRIEPNDQQHN